MEEENNDTGIERVSLPTYSGIFEAYVYKEIHLESKTHKAALDVSLSKHEKRRVWLC